MKRNVILVAGGFRTGERSAERACSMLYAEAVLTAGGLPVLYLGGMPDPNEFGGLLLTGGGDPDPVLSGQGQDARLRNIDVRRDREELALLRAFAAADRRIFGICRGMQMINIAFGGKLYPHVERHDGAPHRVDLRPGSRLEQLCGGRLLVNSYHHQAVLTVGKELITSAWAADGSIEGLEHEKKHILGVQWHPERMLRGQVADTADDMMPLFRWLTAS